MKTDLAMQQAVLEDLTCEPYLHGVEVGDGIVTLEERINSGHSPLAAQCTAGPIYGAKALAVDIAACLRQSSAEVNGADVSWRGQVDSFSARALTPSGAWGIFGVNPVVDKINVSAY